jgi:hypothetical protein
VRSHRSRKSVAHLHIGGRDRDRAIERSALLEPIHERGSLLVGDAAESEIEHDGSLAGNHDSHPDVWRVLGSVGSLEAATPRATVSLRLPRACARAPRDAGQRRPGEILGLPITSGRWRCWFRAEHRGALPEADASAA